MVDLPLLNLRPEAVLRFMADHPSFRESAIVADAYELNTASAWAAPLYRQVGSNGRYMFRGGGVGYAGIGIGL